MLVLERFTLASNILREDGAWTTNTMPIVNKTITALNGEVIMNLCVTVHCDDTKEHSLRYFATITGICLPKQLRNIGIFSRLLTDMVSMILGDVWVFDGIMIENVVQPRFMKFLEKGVDVPNIGLVKPKQLGLSSVYWSRENITLWAPEYSCL